MKIHSLNTGYFKLDGGAMFGVVPKSLWQKKNQSDSDNLCTWAMRCLLIEDENRLILVDTGMGNKQDEKFRGYYQPREQRTFEVALSSFDFHALDITDVILSHLHFDHAGGAVQWNVDRTKFEMTFPNANYWCHSKQWQLSQNPNPREKATFLKENLLPIFESGHLKFIDENQEYFKNYRMNEVFGHTEGMVLPEFEINNQKIIFGADLFPSTAHINPTWVMAYDTQPLIAISEKAIFLERICNDKILIVFDHDPLTECAFIEKTEKGYAISWKGSLSEVF